MDSLRECTRLLDGLHDVLIWESDAEARFTYVNQSAMAMVGYPPEQWLGEAEAWTGFLHPDDQKWVRQLCLEETRKHQSYHCEFRFITADHRILWVRKHAYLKTRADGKIDGMRGVMIDITEEKRIAELQARSEARYRIATRGTRSMIWDWDPNTNVLLLTEGISELFAYPADRMRSDVYFWYDNIHPDDRERVVLGIHARLDSAEESWEDEYRFRTDAGSYVFVQSRGQIIRDEQGHALRMVGSTTDISQRKKMEQDRYLLLRQERQALARAEQALRSQNEIIGVLSHDLKNPLSSILLNVLLASRMIGSDERGTRLAVAMDRIHHAAVRMKDLLSDLVDLARAEAGNLKIEADSVLASELVERLVPETAKAIAEESQGKLEVESLDHGVLVTADRDRIRLAAVKIARFLARRGPRGALLTLRVGVLEDQIVFRVRHPSLELEPEVLAHLFERKGSEMDLAIVRGVILAHEGRIWATSARDGGTSIYFALNAAAPYQAQKAG